MQTEKNKRRTTTERQIEDLHQLQGDELLTKAAESLHALNRRAKEKRDRSRQFRGCHFAEAVRNEIDVIYQLKDRFLCAVVDADQATVETFVESRPSGWECHDCDHSWGGCSDRCFECGGTGCAVVVRKTWCVVRVGRYRFHTPKPSAKMLEIATEVTPHNPAQPQREIPKVGLTIAAQHACIKMAIERLSRKKTLPRAQSIRPLATQGLEVSRV